MPDFLDKMTKKYSKKIDQNFSLRRMSDTKVRLVPSMKTRALGLDHMFRVDGIPRGRIIELFGNESSGKTTLSLFIAAEFIRGGGNVVYIDAEHALDPKYMKAIGVDLSKVFLSQPDTGEEGVEVAQKAAEACDRDDKLLIIIDSIASLVPKKELENPMDKESIGLQARLMGKFMRKIKGIANKNLATIICINQVRLKIGVFWGDPETTPGGKALKFYATARVKIQKIKNIKRGSKEKAKKIGIRSRITAIKNKVGAPYFKTEVEMRDGNGIDYVLNTYEILKELKILKGRDLDDIEKLLESKPKTLKKVRKKMMGMD